MSGEVFDDPNRQAVGLDPVWVEGTGGQEGEAAAEQPEQETIEEDYESWRHVDLLSHAQEIGASPANQGMTKAELIASIEAKEAEG